MKIDKKILIVGHLGTNAALMGGRLTLERGIEIIHASEPIPQPTHPEPFYFTNPYQYLSPITGQFNPITRKQRREQERRLKKLKKKS